jgi:hypothetical protein
MVSTGPLLPADLAQLATTRALSCLLEMRLSTNEEGLLCNRGEAPPPFTPPQVGLRGGAVQCVGVSPPASGRKASE